MDLKDFNKLDLTELDKDLSEEQQKEWNAIYASYRSNSLLTGRVAGMDINTLKIKNPKTGENETVEINCLVIIGYRVKVLIPEKEIWFDEETKRPPHVLRSMTGAMIDYVITNVDRENDICLASRRKAMSFRRYSFLKLTPEPGRKIECRVVAVGRTRLLVEAGGYDISLSPRDVSYAMLPDMRERYHAGETHAAVIKKYDKEKNALYISIKEAEPHPFDGADLRHPVKSRRASFITGKYGGGVFCRLEDNLDCLCTYSANQYDGDFQINDQVIVAVTKFNYTKKVIFGKIVARW